MTNDKITFSFGKNWEEFVQKHLSQERIHVTKTHILEFLEMPSLEGKYFLDIGCGSGLSSLAALEAGAAKVVSFDVDPSSVSAAQRIREIKENPANWTVLHGSILDEAFVSSLEQADIVHAWGVLHHTGDMWKAIERTAKLMKEDGLMYIALYTTTPKSDYWHQVKIRYNQMSPTGKKVMEYWYVFRHTLIPHFIRLKNPFRHIRQYRQSRGMAYFTDVKDWLGGYPYEHAKVEEVLRFCRTQFNLELVNIRTGEANTEYLFAKRHGSASGI